MPENNETKRNQTSHLFANSSHDKQFYPAHILDTISVVYYMYSYANTCTDTIQADSVVSDTNGLLISDFGPYRHEERDTFLTMLTPLTGGASCDF